MYVVFIHEKREKQKQTNQCSILIPITEIDSCLFLSKLLYGLFFNLKIWRNMTSKLLIN